MNAEISVEVVVSTFRPLTSGKATKSIIASRLRLRARAQHTAISRK